MRNPSSKTTPFIGRWLLVRVDDDDDGKAVALELDDIQASLKTHYNEQINMVLGTITLKLTGLQTREVQEWWRDPQ